MGLLSWQTGFCAQWATTVWRADSWLELVSHDFRGSPTEKRLYFPGTNIKCDASLSQTVNRAFHEEKLGSLLHCCDNLQLTDDGWSKHVRLGFCGACLVYTSISKQKHCCGSMSNSKGHFYRVLVATWWIMVMEVCLLLLKLHWRQSSSYLIVSITRLLQPHYHLDLILLKEEFAVGIYRIDKGIKVH